MKKKIQLQKQYMLIVMLCSFIVTTVCFSYAIFTSQLEKQNVLNIVAGDLHVDLSVDFKDEQQVTVEANSKKIVTVTITNHNPIRAKYKVYYQIVSGNKENISVGYHEVSNVKLNEDVLIEKDQVKTVDLVLENKNTEDVILKIGSVVGLEYPTLEVPKGCIEINTEKNAVAEPELVSGMIPVVYNGSNWVKADTSGEWYNYKNQEWANAVTLDQSSKLLDLSGNGHHGTVVGATKKSNALSLDGVNDYIDCGLVNYDFKDSFTLVIRTKIDPEINTGVSTIISNIEKSGFNLYYEKNDSDQSLIIGFGTKDGGWRYTLISEMSKEYQTIVVTYDGSYIKIYINGVLKKSEAATGEVSVPTTPILIGANPQLDGIHVNYVQMDMKEALIFDRALTEEEVITNYKDENIKVTNANQLLFHYQANSDKIPTGTVLPMDYINSMYTWIPRYSYTIKSEDGTNYYGRSYPDLGGISPATKATPGAIDVKFTTKTSSLENGSAKYTESTVTNWYTHPAFCFGTLTTPDDRTTCKGEEVNGLWIGKFENSPEEGSSCATNPSAANCNNAEIKTAIKPGQPSYANINLANAFYTVRNMQLNNFNYYGLPNNTNYDIHLMKGIEWGVVTYLSQSIYGKYGNPNYTGANKEIYVNYYQGYQTGCSGGSPNPTDKTICYSYNDIENNRGVGASTTGNITGIYDMNGGGWEWSIVIMKYEDGSVGVGASGFSSLPERKYYDLYPYHTSITDYTNYYKGDGYQLHGWYNDHAQSFGTAKWIFASRGGSVAIGENTLLSGIFAYGYNDGMGRPSSTFRTVLKP